MGQKITRNELSEFLDSHFLGVFSEETGLNASGPKQEMVVLTDEEPWLAAVSWLGGRWFGNITLAMPKRLAVEIAAKMKNMSPGALSDSDIRAALEQLIGDSAEKLKALIPGRCGIAKPGVFEVSSNDELEGEYGHVVAKTYRSGTNKILCEIQSLSPIDD